jgi:hypothetical protein
LALLLPAKPLQTFLDIGESLALLKTLGLLLARELGGPPAAARGVALPLDLADAPLGGEALLLLLVLEAVERLLQAI